MKNSIKILALLFLINFGLTSCNSDEKEETENPEQTGVCLDHLTLDTYFDIIIYLDFIDDANGWALGYNQTDAGKRILLNTSDGGVNWTLIDGDFKLDFDNGYVSGEALQFVSATNGFKLVNYAPNEKLKIQYTIDKGVTWNEYTNPFLDTVDHWVETFASNGSETIFSGDHNKYVVKVNNTTMEISYSQKLENEIFINDNSSGTVHFSENGTITAVIDSSDVSIAQSTDNGTTWTTVQDAQGYFTTGSWVNDSIGFFAFGLGYSGADTIYKTTDGGATWESYETSDPNSSSTPKFQMIRFVDENNGIGVTDFGFYVTSDGGHVWHEKRCYTAEGQYNAGFSEVLSYPSLDNGWVAGSDYNNYETSSIYGVFHYQGE